MAKGTAAFFIVLSLILSMSILGGIGFYSTMGVSYSDSAEDDVQEAASALIGQQASDQSSGSVLQDFTTSAGSTLSVGWQVIANLSGIVQLLFGVPSVLAEGLQTLWMLTYSITFAAFIRGVRLQ
jgi:hypothetical protein